MFEAPSESGSNLDSQRGVRRTQARVQFGELTGPVLEYGYAGTPGPFLAAACDW
jgi:hypothetical protein